MAKDFDGKRVIVMGGSRGIGRSIALGFAAGGAAVSICARSAGPLEATRREIAAHGVTAHAASVDLADAAAITAYLPQAVRRSAGSTCSSTTPRASATADDEEGWAASLSVDMMAVVRGSHAAIPHMQPGSSIVNISSISALRASSRSAPYGAVKAAVMHYTASQAKMLAQQGIRVNCVAPGSIEFPGGTWEDRRTSNPELYRSTLATHPVRPHGPARGGRRGRALPRLRAKASWVTGQSIVVDGGQLVGP